MTAVVDVVLLVALAWMVLLTVRLVVRSWREARAAEHELDAWPRENREATDALRRVHRRVLRLLEEQETSEGSTDEVTAASTMSTSAPSGQPSSPGRTP